MVATACETVISHLLELIHESIMHDEHLGRKKVVCTHAEGLCHGLQPGALCARDIQFGFLPIFLLAEAPGIVSIG